MESQDLACCKSGKRIWFSKVWKQPVSVDAWVDKMLRNKNTKEYSVQFSSVAQSCPTLYDPRNRSMPKLPVHHQLRESTQTHVHWVGDAIQPSHPLSSLSPPALNLSQHQGLFKWVSSSHQMAKVLALKKELLPLWQNMDKPEGYYARWNKPDTEIKILHNLTYI